MYGCSSIEVKFIYTMQWFLRYRKLRSCHGFSKVQFTHSFLFLGALLLFSGSLYAAQLSSVTIQGIDGRLYDNVAANLEIFQKSGEEELGERLIKKLHGSAEEQIREALQPFGFYSPTILAELVEEEEGFRATYSIQAGEPVIIRTVNIELGRKAEVPHDALDVIDSFTLKAGDVLDHSVYEKGKKDLLQQLFARGYVQAEFSKSEIRVYPKNKSAEIEILINSGAQFQFGKTLFDQNVLDPDLLQRYINYKEGEPYSLRKLLQLQQTLYRTNYFGQVSIQGDMNNIEDVSIPVVIKLTPREFNNRYSFGIGYATDDGLRGTLGWENRLLNRYGHTLSARLKFAEREEEFESLYGIPVLDPRYDKILLGFTYGDEDWQDTDTRYTSGGISFEHAGPRIRYNGGLEIRQEEFKIGESTDESFLPIPHLGWSLAYGDDLINTKNGVFVSLTVKGASELLFAETSFLQGVATGKAIVTPVTGIRIIGRGSLGATLVDSFSDLPPSLRFYAGGDQSVRGFDYRELGSTDDDGIVIGGKYLIFGSLEVEKLINENWSVAAFYDVGKGVNDLSESLGRGVGAGIRYRLPFGQIRVDVASALSEENRPIRLHFAIGGDL